ncbi:hypothetical protein [uncultured Aquimarina sp.]|uniref:hypothetical protein n=1 Tax=uncultured Aquimarina sp. TaxID=575652 RepID=UPI002628D62D|nr:hypothetical protein [uncultured Aquimarina sp.]
MKNSIRTALLILCFGFTKAQELKCLNIQYKLRGYFYAGTSKSDIDAPGGFYQANNKPIKNNQLIKEIGKTSDFQLVVKVDSIAEFQKGVKGFKVFLINNTDSIIKLSAQDSRLSVIRQVFHNNKWQDIEYLPSSWCGNSYHSVYINPKEYWNFIAPCTEGKIKSKFRFKLYIGKTQSLYDTGNIYSNEFEGSFNKKQLKEEQGHKPINIMDSYNN